MSKFAAVAAILLVLGLSEASLFGPLGPFGPPAPLALQPEFVRNWSPFGPPAAQTAFFQSGFAPFASPYSPFLGSFPFRSAVAGPAFRTKPSTVLERLTAVTLPADLQQRLDELLVAFEAGNRACDDAHPAATVGGPLSGLHRRCAALQKRETEQAAFALEQEANSRTAAAAAVENSAGTAQVVGA